MKEKYKTWKKNCIVVLIFNEDFSNEERLLLTNWTIYRKRKKKRNKETKRAEIQLQLTSALALDEINTR